MNLLVFIFASMAMAKGPELCQELHSAPSAKVYQCDRLKVVSLSGSGKTRFEAYGELLRGPLNPTVVDYFSHRIVAIAENPIERFGLGVFVNLLTRLLHRQAPAVLAEEVDAMAKGMKADPIALRRGLSLADLSTVFHRWGAAFPFLGIPATGCTSLATNSKDQGLWFGRNLDFIGVGHWDRNPSIIIHSPPAPQLKYMAFSADGMPWSGITGANEAGIFFAVHQNYSSSATLSGVPMPFIGELVLRQSRSLKEAEAVVRDFRPSSLWTFLVADLKTGEAVAIEVSPHTFGVRPIEGGRFAQTNHAFLEETKLSNQISTGTKFNSEKRWTVAMEALASGEPSFETLRSVLAYQKSALGWMQPEEDVLKAHTVQTVIVEGSQGIWSRLWLSQDEAPTASGSFLAFDPMDLFLLPQPLFFTRVSPQNETSQKRKHQKEIAEAFSAYFDNRNFQKAKDLLKHHHTLSAGLFRATATHNQGLWGESLQMVEELVSDPKFLGEPAHLRESLHWLRLANLARLGQWEKIPLLAEKQLKDGVRDARRKAQLKRMAAGAKVVPPEPTFEFFTGDLASPGSTSP
jgi:hypothetical protein